MIKIVDFYNYCRTCEFRSLKEEEEPCCDCLAEPGREDGRIPVYYKEDENAAKKSDSLIEKRNQKRRKKK